MRYLIGIISPLPPSIKVTMVLYEDERDKYPPFPDLYMHCVQRPLSLTINNINSSWLSNSSPTTASASACRGIPPISLKSPSKRRSEIRQNSILPQNVSTASLQSAVDTQIRRVGFVPDASYGSGNISGAPLPAMRQVSRLPEPPSSNPQTSHPEEPAWSCSEKQRQVILSLARKNGINNSELHDLAVLCFGKGASQLNKLEASSLINELIEKSGGTSRKAPSFGSCAQLQEVAAPEMR